MASYTLTEAQTQSLLNVLMTSTGHPWNVTHPLIATLLEQRDKAQAAQAAMERDAARADTVPGRFYPKGNSSEEAEHGTAAPSSVEGRGSPRSGGFAHE